jgi:hypothetical protein
VGLDVRQHARADSISKRAPSTTRTSLHFGINGLRAVRNSVAKKSSFNLAVAKCAFYSAVYGRARREHRENCDRPSNLSRSLTPICIRFNRSCHRRARAVDGGRRRQARRASVTQREALARRAAAAGVAIQTLSSFRGRRERARRNRARIRRHRDHGHSGRPPSIGEMLRPIGARPDDHSSVAR